MNVSVIGCGRLGAPYAVSLAELGHHVLGVDTDTAQLAALAAGKAPFDEPGLGELIAAHHEAGTLTFSNSYQDAVNHADVHFVCVPTPQQADSDHADLNALRSAVLELTVRADRPTVIVGKSSVPVGTSKALAAEIDAITRSPLVDLCWSPDFLRESTSVEDANHPTRIVLGVPQGDERAQALLQEVWEPWLSGGVPLVVTSWETAELAKSAANAFLATKISFINAMAAVCEASGADIATLSESLSYDPRIGSAMLAAGLGWGGSCIPKDLHALVARSGELSVPEAALFREVDAVNTRRRQRVIGLTRDLLGGQLAGSTVAVWGAAFKAGTDDLRDSPALAVCLDLHRAGVRVVVHDPKALSNVRALHPQLDCADTALNALDGSDVLLHLTAWPDYQDIDPKTAAARMAVPRLVDARGSLNPDAWTSAGFEHRALGNAPARLPAPTASLAGS